MTKDEIFDRVRREIHELFDVDVETIKPETRLIDELGLDSVDAIDLAARMEEMTKTRMTEKNLRKLRTVQDVVDLIFEMLPADKP